LKILTFRVHRIPLKIVVPERRRNRPEAIPKEKTTIKVSENKKKEGKKNKKKLKILTFCVHRIPLKIVVPE
jgi:hypothetical protein